MKGVVNGIVGITRQMGENMHDKIDISVEIYGVSHGGSPKSLSQHCLMHQFDLMDSDALTNSVFKLNALPTNVISSDSLRSIAPRLRDTSFDLSRLATELCIEPEDPTRGLQPLKDSEPVAVRLGP